MQLKLERFGLPNKPSETPAPVWAMVRNRRISHAEHRNLLKEGSGAEIGEGAYGPLPLAPIPKGDNPSVVSLAPLYPQGSRSEPEGRAFWSKEYCVLFVENKPTGTPGCFEKTFRCEESP